jgi:hypothetical protein
MQTLAKAKAKGTGQDKEIEAIKAERGQRGLEVLSAFGEHAGLQHLLCLQQHQVKVQDGVGQSAYFVSLQKFTINKISSQFFYLMPL